VKFPQRIFRQQPFYVDRTRLPITLIVVARQLAQKGIYVYLGSRKLENGIAAVNKLLAEGLNYVEAIQLELRMMNL
jgi:hypothetical protein